MFVITREFLPTFRVSLKISWEPGSLAPGEYPTLGLLVLKGHVKRTMTSLLQLSHILVGNKYNIDLTARLESSKLGGKGSLHQGTYMFMVFTLILLRYTLLMISERAISLLKKRM